MKKENTKCPYCMREYMAHIPQVSGELTMVKILLECRQKEINGFYLKNKFNMSYGTIHSAVKNLKKRGFIKTKKSISDKGRSEMLLVVTKKGEEQITPLLQEGLINYLKDDLFIDL